MNDNEYEDYQHIEENEEEFENQGLTKLEKEELKQALQKQRENIVRPQVVLGKEFKGNAFISKPAEIIFKDFDVGQPMVQVITLTNVSYSFNSFKLLPINEAIQDFFELSHKPPGRMSAGMSCPIQIKFIPQLRQDIFDNFKILSQTGEISIPIKCTYKKAIVKSEQNVIDFGKVIFGEDSTKNLKFINEGALETDIVFKNINGINLQKYDNTSSVASSTYHGRSVAKSRQDLGMNKSEEKEENTQDLEKYLEQLQFIKKTSIKGYSNISIPFKYIPNEIGKFELQIIVYFEIYEHSPQVMLTIKGECVEVPLYIEKPVYDFEICLLEHTFREKLVFHNRSSNAMKIQILVPKETKNFVEFNPTLGYIQGNSKFEIWTKLVLSKDLQNICAKYINNDELVLPFKLVGADQVMPVNFELKARITIDAISLYPNKIDFGQIIEGSASKFRLYIENKSLLPQEILFYPLPKKISYEPNLIPFKLLPREKLPIDFIYRSQEIGTEENNLRAKIVTGNLSTRDIKIPYHVEITKCPLKFSLNKMDMPVLQINESFNTNFEIRNTSQKEYIFEFFLPHYEICGLKITPMVLKLQSGKVVNINLEYTSFFKKLEPFTLVQLKQKYENDPNYNFQVKIKKIKEEELQRVKEEEENKKNSEDKNKLNAGKDKKKVPEKKPEQKQQVAPPKKDAKQAQKELELEQLRQQELEKIRLEEERLRQEEIMRQFDLETELQNLGGKLYEFYQNDQKHTQNYVWLVPCFYMQVDNIDAKRNQIFIEVTTTTINKVLIADKDEIDFGEIAVGFRKIQDLVITNIGDRDENLKMDLLPQFCGFSVVNALRKIKPQSSQGLVIQFEPRNQQVYEETLKIYSDTSCISIQLKGKGVQPEVNLEPESGLLDIGSVLVNEQIEKSFKIKNISNFKLHFKLNFKARGIRNKNLNEVFQYVPQEADIEANKEIIVKVIFKPDRVSEKFFDYILIDVPNQINEKYLYIQGSCYQRQAYVTYYKRLGFPSQEDINLKSENLLDFINLKDENTVLSLENNKILLEFQKILGNDEDTELCTNRKIKIGNCKLLDPKLEKPCNFEIIMPKEDKSGYFSCDNVKGAVTGGNEVIIGFKYNPPQIDPFIASLKALNGIGQWIEYKVELKLIGGYIPPGMVDAIVFEVILRAYVNQI